MHGYFLDNGTPVDPDSIETPEMSKNCRKNSQPGERMLCNLNRIDQQEEIANAKEFRCEAFVKA